MSLFAASPIYVITDKSQSAGRSNMEVVKSALEAGARFIQYREKRQSLREMYAEGLLLRELTATHGAALIVDDYADLALAIAADGVHVGQDDLPPAAVRALSDNLVIGYSTHNAAQLTKAVALFQQGIIDYIGVGPVYPTRTKENPAPVAGLDYVKAAAKAESAYGLPFVAIGGIKEHNIAAVATAGAKCCAVVSDITLAPDIGAKISRLKDAMSRVGEQ